MVGHPGSVPRAAKKNNKQLCCACCLPIKLSFYQCRPGALCTRCHECPACSLCSDDRWPPAFCPHCLSLRHFCIALDILDSDGLPQSCLTVPWTSGRLQQPSAPPLPQVSLLQAVTPEAPPLLLLQPVVLPMSAAESPALRVEGRAGRQLRSSLQGLSMMRPAAAPAAMPPTLFLGLLFKVFSFFF